MDAIVELSWRAYPASLLAAGGAALAAWGIARGYAGFRLPTRDPAKLVTAMSSFRLAVIGLALAAIAAAWIWGILWLLVLALAIGGEETLESSVHLFALKHGATVRIQVSGR